MTTTACLFRKHMRTPAARKTNTGPMGLLARSLMVSLLFLLSCAPGAMDRPQIHTIAVWPIENVSAQRFRNLDVGELFAMQVAEVIKNHGVHRVVERQQLVLALEELNIGTSLLVEESTRLKLGRLVGARYMVFGAYQVLSEQMRIDLRLVDVQSGQVLKAVSGTSRGSDMDIWLKTVQSAASNLL